MGAITLVLLVTVAVEGRILCREIGLLGAPTKLTCIEASRIHSFIAPNGLTAGSCDTSTRRCITTGHFKASFINTTSSVLTIPALLKSDAGAWKCSSAGDVSDSPSCNMTVAKFPTCTITRRQNDGVFTVGELKVALKVNVTGDYCSESAQFQLQTGNIQTGLNYLQWKENTDVILNLTESHLGEVKLVFICGGYSEALPCEGIQELRSVNTFDDDSTGGKEEHCRSTVVIAGTVGVVVIVINVLAVIVCLRRHHCQNRQPPAGYLGAVYVPGSAASDYGYATVDDVGYASGQYLRPTVD